MPSNSTAGAISVLFENDLVHEVRHAVRSAHRARKRGRPYAVELSDGIVRVAITFADEGDGDKSAAGRAGLLKK